jgi:hypothetical protein
LFRLIVVRSARGGIQRAGRWATLASALMIFACGRTPVDPLTARDEAPTACSRVILDRLSSPRELTVLRGRLFWLEMPDDDTRSLELKSLPSCVDRVPERIAPVAWSLERGGVIVWWIEPDGVHLAGGGESYGSGDLSSAWVDDTHVFWVRREFQTLGADVRGDRFRDLSLGLRSLEVIGARAGYVFDLERQDRGAPRLRRTSLDSAEATPLADSGFFSTWTMSGEALYVTTWTCLDGSHRCVENVVFEPENFRSTISRVDPDSGARTVLVDVAGDLIADVEITEQRIFWAQTRSIFAAQSDGSELQRLVDVDAGWMSIAVEDDHLYWAAYGWSGDVIQRDAGHIGYASLRDLDALD